MPDSTVIVIPARMASTRLPGKPLADIHGKPMIVRVWERAMAAKLGHVLVAAAETPIAEAIWKEGGDAILTDPKLPSGSDRAKAALDLRDPEKRFTHVVNLQGDLPTIDPALIATCLEALSQQRADIATLAVEITNTADLENPNIVKAIASLDANHPVAIAINFQRKLSSYAKPPHWHHIGIYAYHRTSLERFVSLSPSANEMQHKLEQLRALDNGMRISIARVDTIPVGVDTREDLDLARRLLKKELTQ